MKEYINAKFLELLNNGNKRLTIILGSGYHQQAIGDKFALANWGNLLSKLAGKNVASKNLTFEFERIIIGDKGNVKKTSLIERDVLEEVKKIIEFEQEWVLSRPKIFKYPEVLNPKFVSDVISLNFDHVAEKVAKNKYGLNSEIITENKSSFKDHTKKTFLHDITSYQSFKDTEEKEIRFWHPHGSITNPKNLVLGITRYSNLVASTLRIKNHYKKTQADSRKISSEYNEWEVDLTWLSQIINNPVIILGASMSQLEWVMWTAFIFRKRNFGKSINKDKGYPIFKMMSKNEIDNNENWFEPLFFNLDFSDQWDELSKLLGNK